VAAVPTGPNWTLPPTIPNIKKKAGGDVSVYRVENNLGKSGEFNSINSYFQNKEFHITKTVK
jgi:hypothetical protein